MKCKGTLVLEGRASKTEDNVMSVSSFLRLLGQTCHCHRLCSLSNRVEMMNRDTVTSVQQWAVLQWVLNWMKIHLGLVSSHSMGLSRWLLSKTLPLQAWWPEFDLQNPCKQNWTWWSHVLLKAVLVTQRWLCSSCSLDIQLSLIGKFQCFEGGGGSEEQHPWLSSALHTPHTHKC